MADEPAVPVSDTPQFNGSADAYDEVIEVKTGMLGLGKRLYVPFSNIQEVITDSVFLSVGGFDSDLEPFKRKPEYLDKLH